MDAPSNLFNPRADVVQDDPNPLAQDLSKANEAVLSQFLSQLTNVFDAMFNTSYSDAQAPPIPTPQRVYRALDCETLAREPEELRKWVVVLNTLILNSLKILHPAPIDANGTAAALELRLTGDLRKSELLPRNKQLDYLDLASTKESHYRAFQKHSWSFAKYMEQSLYGVNGYYSSSKVQIGVQGDFRTAATSGDCLSHQIVNQAFLMFVKMVEAKDISGDHFDFIECGAGTGQMANKVLSYIRLLKDKFPNDAMVQKFAKAFHYTIGEISPELRRKQTKLNEKFINEGKLTVVAADARNLGNTFKPGQFKGVFVSNELPDVFPLHCLKITKDNEVLVKNVIPIIHAQDIPQDLLAEVMKYNSEEFHSQDLITFPNNSQDYSVFPLKLLDKLPEAIKNKLKWKHVYLPVKLYPELGLFLKRSPMFLEGVKEDRDFYINLDAPKLMKGIEAILEKGFVITVDYGNPIHFEMLEKIRTYGKVKKEHDFVDPSNDFHNYFQGTDITANVCFHTLAEATNGLETLGTFRQNELKNGMRDFDQTTFETERFLNFDPNYSDSDWTALIQVRKGTSALYGLPALSQNSTSYQIFKGLVNSERHHGEAQIKNQSRLFANAWITYEKYFTTHKRTPSAEEFASFCKQMYGETLEPTSAIAHGIILGMRNPAHQSTLGLTFEKALVKETLKAIEGFRNNKVKEGQR